MSTDLTVILYTAAMGSLMVAIVSLTGFIYKLLKSRIEYQLMSIEKKSFVKPFPWELYLPEGEGPLALICITPILGRLGFLEDLFLERWFARFFSRKGFAVALIDRPIFEFDPSQGIEQIQTYLEDSVRRSIKILDEILKRDDILPTAIGTFGISFGGAVNVLWAARDPRLKAHVFALAGGNIAEIILTSRDPLMKSYLKSILKATGLSKENLLAALQKSISLDPLKLTFSIPRENIFMLLGILDRVIRFRYGLALREALGKPQTVFLPLGHYPALLAIPLLKWWALNFFTQRLQDGVKSRHSP